MDLLERCKKSAEEAGCVFTSSPLDPSCKSCVAYHMKGMCNEACLNAGDNGDHTQEQDMPLTQEQDMPLWNWSRIALPSAGDPANPQE